MLAGVRGYRRYLLICLSCLFAMGMLYQYHSPVCLNSDDTSYLSSQVISISLLGTNFAPIFNPTNLTYNLDSIV